MSRLEPLAGLRVLDFTAFPPGGACTVMLADLGAEVMRVEPPSQKGKPSLVIGQVALSRGKRSIALDLRDPRANAVLLRLAATVDIVVENAKPGAMEQRGFGYAQARRANPALIWCAITGFGQTGPYADHAGHDLSYLAHSGLLCALAGDQDWQPALSIALQAGALSAVVAIQGALLRRTQTGEGAFIDVSLSEAAGWFLTCGINPLSDHPLLLPSTPDRRLYACGDGRFVAVACAEPRTWGVLCDQMDLPELKGALHQAAVADATAAALAAIFLTRPAAEWVERIATAGGAVTLVNHAAQLLSDPQVIAREAVVQVDGIPVPASPLHITEPDGRSTGANTAPPRRVGEDTADVLRSAGYDADELAALLASGLI
jgi:crotonobetainyl-CoA:carnitine CoA-transferase CaiB-like acyl-CoA transferase